MSSPDIRFAWWNLHNFAHYDPGRVGTKRWPVSAAEYDARHRRVGLVLSTAAAGTSPDLIGCCEITRRAAEDLQTRFLPDHRLVYPDAGDDEFHVAVYFRRGRGFRANRLPVVAARVPETTRPMPVVDLEHGGHRCRFVFCHWTAFGENVEAYRQKLAEALAEHLCRHLARDRTARHAVVVGDLNEEPFSDRFAPYLIMTRDREAATGTHRTDAKVGRVRLYNSMWRRLGERHPHPGPAGVTHYAGTCYHEGEWRTWDQVLVSGGLLTRSPPYFDEDALDVILPDGWSGPSGKPEPFAWNSGQPTGQSDHLPVVGRVVMG